MFKLQNFIKLSFIQNMLKIFLVLRLNRHKYKCQHNNESFYIPLKVSHQQRISVTNTTEETNLVRRCSVELSTSSQLSLTFITHTNWLYQ